MVISCVLVLLVLPTLLRKLCCGWKVVLKWYVATAQTNNPKKVKNDTQPGYKEWAWHPCWHLLCRFQLASLMVNRQSVWSWTLPANIWSCEQDPSHRLWYSMDVSKYRTGVPACRWPILVFWYHIASLLNPNQIRASDVDTNDNPFDATNSIGMDCEDAFVPFEMMGMMVYFESRVPMDWEIKHLPRIHITGDTWNSMDDAIFPAGKSQEQAELQTIKSLTSSMTRQQVSMLWAEQAKAQIEEYGKVEHELGKISPVYNVKSFCNHLISSVRITTSDRSDIHDPDMDWKVSAVASKDHHTRLMAEEVARLFNTSIDTMKATLEVTTQYGIWTAIHPMMHQLRVDQLNLHQPRLAGMWFLDTLMAKVKSKWGNTCANVYTQGKFMKVIPMTLRKDEGSLWLNSPMMSEYQISLLPMAWQSLPVRTPNLWRRHDVCIFVCTLPNRTRRTRTMLLSMR